VCDAVPDRVCKIFGVPFKRIIFCELHAKLRITEKLLKLLAAKALGRGSAFVTALETKLQEILHYPDFKFIRSKKADAHLVVPGLAGNWADTLLQHWKEFVPIGDPRQATEKCWKRWASIVKHFHFKDIPGDILPTLRVLLREFGEQFVAAHGIFHVTPYVHIIVCHFEYFVREHHSVSIFSQQGFEAAHRLQRMFFARSTSRGGGHEKRRVCLALMRKHWRSIVLGLYRNGDGVGRAYMARTLGYNFEANRKRRLYS